MAKKRGRTRSKRKPRVSKNDYDMSYVDSFRYRPRKQRGGFLSRYDFAYAGRDTVNQVAHHVNKIAPRLIDQTFDRARDLAPNLIRKTSRELDMITGRRINQITRQTGDEIQRIAPGIIKGAIEELYRTLFRLLGQFGKNKYRQLKSKVCKRLRIKR